MNQNPSHIILSESSLPPKPVDPHGRFVVWALVTAEPGIIYRGKRITVDQDFMDRQVEQFAKMTELGYETPVLREHEHNGENDGDILDYTQHTYEGREVLLAALALNDPEAETKVKSRRFKYVSPSFKSFEDDRGNKFHLALTEISLVSAPHQKRLGSTHILAKETVMDDKKPEETPEEEGPSMAERVAAMEKSVEDIKAAMAEYFKPKDEEPEEEEPKEEEPEMAQMSETDRRVARLEAELEAEKKRRRFADFRSTFQAGAQVTLSENLIEDLFEMSEKAPKVWNTLKGHATAPAAEATEGGKPARRAEFVDWGASLASSEGNGGETVNLSEMDDDALMDELKKKHQGDREKALTEFGIIRYSK